MYLNMFGGSGLLHILAGHPRLVAAFGLAGAVGLLASPVGPGTYRGTASYATAVERVVQDRGTGLTVANAERQTDGELNETRDELEPIVRRTLAECGPACSDVSIDSVFGDRNLLRQVLVLDAIDSQVHAAAPTVSGSK